MSLKMSGWSMISTTLRRDWYLSTFLQLQVARRFLTDLFHPNNVTVAITDLPLRDDVFVVCNKILSTCVRIICEGVRKARKLVVRPVVERKIALINFKVAMQLQKYLQKLHVIFFRRWRRS